MDRRKSIKTLVIGGISIRCNGGSLQIRMKTAQLRPLKKKKKPSFRDSTG